MRPALFILFASFVALSSPFISFFKLQLKQTCHRSVFSPSVSSFLLFLFLRHRSAFVNEVKLQQSELRSNNLLGRMLPLMIINELKSGNEFIANHYPAVTIMFCKIFNFDLVTAQFRAMDLVDILNHIFSNFDNLTEKHAVYKVETIGKRMFYSMVCECCR